MKLLELLSHYAKRLNDEREIAMSRGLDAPIEIPKARYLRTTGSLHLYSLELPDAKRLIQDVSVTILPSNNSEPTEGINSRTTWSRSADSGARVVRNHRSIVHAYPRYIGFS